MNELDTEIFNEVLKHIPVRGEFDLDHYTSKGHNTNIKRALIDNGFAIEKTNHLIELTEKGKQLKGGNLFRYFLKEVRKIFKLIKDERDNWNDDEKRRSFDLNLESGNLDAVYNSLSERLKKRIESLPIYARDLLDLNLKRGHLN
jgi:hypothetical protein